MLTKILAATALVAAANADTQNQCHQHTSEDVFFNLEGLKSQAQLAAPVIGYTFYHSYCADSPSLFYTKSGNLSN